MPKITPFLWFETRLQDVLAYYTSIFRDGKITSTQPGPNGELLTATFEIEGQQFMAINGGPEKFKFNESISFFVTCKDQDEVDYYWNALTADGGAESMCGWCKDKYGVSWQIIPDALMQTIGGDDREGAGRAMQAMFQMHKIIVADLEKAYRGTET